MDAALEKVRSAISKDPSDYKAKGLEGELLLAQARQEKDKNQTRRALELLQAASNRFVEALAVAPSDTSLWLGEAKVQVEMLRNSKSEPFMDRAILRCREIARTCLIIRPSDPRPLAQVAMAVYWSDDRPSSRGARMEAMLREGVRLTEQVLEMLPADYDAHYARIGLLESLVIRERDRGADPTQTLELVVETTKKALALHPGDWALISVGTEVAKTKMVCEGQSGRGVEPGFQFAVALAEDLMRHNPTHPIAHLRMAQLHVERADFNCRNGIDPRASVEKAQEFLESARKLNLDSGSFLTTLGDTWLIRAQYAFAVGADPKPDLLQALDCYQRRVDGQSTTRGSFGNLAEACFYMAILSARDSRDPGGWLNRAETAIQKGLLLDDYHWLHQLRGQCAWVRARWLVASDQDPSPDFAKSVKELRAASEKAHAASADRWIAKVLLDRALYLTQSRKDVADGLRAAQKSLNADPSSGESEFLMGQLKLEAAGSASPGSAAKLRDEAQFHLQRAIQLNCTFKARKSRFRSAKESIRSLDP
jgi:tetratricopeptide (TPR) repeat protein